MHSLVPYEVRLYDRSLPGPVNERHTNFNDLHGGDFLDFFQSYLNRVGDGYDVRASQVFGCRDIRVSGRIISGFFEYGTYGSSSKIINTSSSEVTYEKGSDESDVADYYFVIELPENSNKGILLIQAINGQGVKSVFSRTLQEFYKDRQYRPTLNIKPLTTVDAVQQWIEEAEVKELRLMNYLPNNDVSDIADALGDSVRELVVKARRGSVLGYLRDFIDSGSQVNTVASYNEVCTEVKAKVKLNGRFRTFSLRSEAAPHHAVEFDEENVDMDNGVPVRESIEEFAILLLRDFRAQM